MGWLSTIIGAGSALVAGGLSIEARKNEQKQQQYLANTKLQLQSNLNTALQDPANRDAKASDLVNTAMKNIDEENLSSSSRSNMQNFLLESTTKAQEALNTMQHKRAEQSAIDGAINLTNQLRNHVGAGTIDIAGAENLYEGSVGNVLKKNLSQSDYDKYERQFKSAIRLDSLKNMSSDEAHKALQTSDYMNNMTASDYQTAVAYSKSKHVEAVKTQSDLLNLQHKLATDVLSGKFTPNEINIMKAQHQDVSSSALMHTVHTFSLIKKMTVPELQEILKPPSTQRDKNGNVLPIDQMRAQAAVDDNFKGIVLGRISGIEKESQKNLVNFAANNDELAPLNLTNGVSVKTSMANRVVQVANLQHKYQAKAKTLFTNEEAQNLTADFANAGNKAKVLSSAAQVLPQSRYSEGDHIFYSGAGADMYSINHGAINFANDSYKGYEIKQAKTTAAIPAKTTTTIRKELQRFVPITDTKRIDSMTNQITNVMIARGIDPVDIQASDIDNLIEESTSSVIHPQKSILGMFAKDAYILAPDKQRASVLSAFGKYKGFWARDNEQKLFAKVTGGADILDLHTSSGAKVDLQHLARHMVLKNLTPTTYTLVYKDYTGVTSALYDKDKKPVIIDANKINQDDIDNFNKVHGDTGGLAVAELRDKTAPQFTNLEQVDESIAKGGNY